MPEITAGTERKLRDAMERLLSGVAVRTDGRINKENLYREAGVSRATMNRATAVMDEWARRVDGTQPRDREIESLRSSLAARTAEIKKLRERLSDLEAHLTIAATTVAELHVENQLLRGDDPTRNVTPMKRPAGSVGSR
ncbi:hypothetical protein [Microbacterium sp. No. 7]|uniref:hypothetical protein n=1 Tax=Microbacterium sp. No. 7 TaxID=1714373 RepID=UPI0006CF2755|nr:hypothetical protein [Microbacterium sp. No. 7]ALJ20583.1 hypothetical protein AOA12_11990 [Microbacterium sp. No. 7]ALJ22403.1 hypothetical protein AOA12_22455 [Microbacterium sp. No. 7]